MFTLQGNSLVSLENEFDGELTDQGVLKHIDLPDSLREDVRLYLEHAGVNRFTLFPDLEGLADHLTDRYGEFIYNNRDENEL